jgi:hypothetical protein
MYFTLRGRTRLGSVEKEVLRRMPVPKTDALLEKWREYVNNLCLSPNTEVIKYKTRPYKLVQRVILLTCSRDVPGSSLGRNTDYPRKRFFMVFLSPSDWTPDCTLNRSRSYPVMSLPVFHLSFILPIDAIHPHRHLWADCLENVWVSNSHNPVGLHGLLQG